MERLTTFTRKACVFQNWNYIRLNAAAYRTAGNFCWCKILRNCLLTSCVRRYFRVVLIFMPSPRGGDHTTLQFHGARPICENFPLCGMRIGKALGGTPLSRDLHVHYTKLCSFLHFSFPSAGRRQCHSSPNPTQCHPEGCMPEWQDIGIVTRWARNATP
jgi:hypothetical protein